MEKGRVRNFKVEYCIAGSWFPEWLGCEKILKFKGYNPQTKQQLLYLYFGLWKILEYKNPPSIYVPFCFNGIQNTICKMSY